MTRPPVQVPNFQRVNHKQDPVAIIPGRNLGYRYTRGEIHILGPGHAVACPGAHLCPASHVQNSDKILLARQR